MLKSKIEVDQNSDYLTFKQSPVPQALRAGIAIGIAVFSLIALLFLIQSLLTNLIKLHNNSLLFFIIVLIGLIGFSLSILFSIAYILRMKSLLDVGGVTFRFDRATNMITVEKQKTELFNIDKLIVRNYTVGNTSPKRFYSLVLLFNNCDELLLARSEDENQLLAAADEINKFVNESVTLNNEKTAAV